MVVLPSRREFDFLVFWKVFIGIYFVCSGTTVRGQTFYFDKITSQNGLTHNTVYAITQDYKGFMWFGTRDGLCRYDSKQIRPYYFANRAPMIEASRINCLASVDKSLYVGTGNGLFTYNFVQDMFQMVTLPFEAPQSVYDILPIAGGRLLVGTQNGVYIFRQQKTEKHILQGQHIVRIQPYKQGIYWVLTESRLLLVNLNGEHVFEAVPERAFGETSPDFRFAALYTDREGTCWLGTRKGIFRFDEKTFVFSPLVLPVLSDNKEPLLVRAITEDVTGNLWLGTESGVLVYDKRTQTFQQYGQSFYESPHRLSDKSVYAAYTDKDGIVWLGTYFGGVNYAKPLGRTFDFIFPDPSSRTLSGKAVSQLKQMPGGDIWIATEDGGVAIRHADHTFSHLSMNNGLSSNNIHALHADPDGSVWIGTFMTGLTIYEPATRQMTRYTHSPTDSTSLSNNSVYAILRDRSGVTWIGTQGGLNVYEPATRRFRLFPNVYLKQAFIYDIAEDFDGNLWFATRYNGLFRYNPATGKVVHFSSQNTPVMHSNQIISIYQDSQHNLWFGSLDGGLIYWNYHQKQLMRVPELEDIPSATVYGILEDDKHDLWFSTNKGLVWYQVSQKRWVAFDKTNGLPTNQFNFKSFLKTEDGRMYFGSINGLCFFDPTVIKEAVFEPVCYFTSLKLFNKEVPITQGKDALLQKHIDETSGITLAYGQNNITLEFVGINYFSEGNNYYTYYLEGFENTWNPKTDKNAITFTNLSPGNYTFHLKVYKSNGQLSTAERRLMFVVQPPFWRSYYAMLVYALLLGGVVFLYTRFVSFVNSQKLAVQVERLDKEKNNELNRQKLNLFTLLAHEFNTPLTLIVALIDKLSTDTLFRKPELLDEVKAIRKNALRMQWLVEQLFELRKAQAEHQNVQFRTTDLVALVKESVGICKPLLDVKKIRLQMEFSHPYFNANLDADKLELMLTNLLFILLSDANDEEALRLEIHIETNREVKSQALLQVSVSGAMPPETVQLLRENILLSETQDELVPQVKASSLSIILITSLLRVLQGSMRVVGDHPATSVVCTIPFLKGASDAQATYSKSQEKKSILEKYLLQMEESRIETDTSGGQTPLPATEKSSLLIAETNKELMLFLKKHFAENYHVRVATSFEEAVQKAEKQVPDVIICDSHLSGSNGQDLCQYLKAAEPTRFIPVILLSEVDNEQSVLKGLHSGADAFLKKPFKLKELDLLVKNVLKSRVLYKEKVFNSLSRPVLHKLPEASKDQKLILAFAELVAQHYKDHNLTAEQLADKMNCSRSLLHTKLKKLSGLSTKEYLNEYRLTMAHQLLREGAQVAEAAYQVGFNDPNYFSRVFKQKYGISPSQVAAQPSDS